MTEKSKAIHPAVRIGHVHLKVADLARAINFYRDVLGFEVTQRYVIKPHSFLPVVIIITSA
jgi:catechol 2,3-dioxygenase